MQQFKAILFSSKFYPTVFLSGDVVAVQADTICETCTSPCAAFSLKAPRAKALTTALLGHHRHTSTAAEVLFLYDEVYSEQQYTQHGIQLRPGDTVLDVGANIGMFSMLAAEVRRQA